MKTPTKNKKINRKRSPVSSPPQKQNVGTNPEITIVEQSQTTMKIQISEEKLIGKFIKSADDPAVALNIYYANLSSGLSVINALPALNWPAVPLWLSAVGLNYPLTVDGFIMAILRVAQGVTNGGIVENFCICPNTSQESTAIITRFAEFNSVPFILFIANAAGGSLARLHGFHERKVVQTASNFNIPRPLDITAADFQAFV